MTWNSIGEKLHALHRSAQYATTQRAVTVNVVQVDENGNSYNTPRVVADNGTFVSNRIWVNIEGDLSKPVAVWNVGPGRVAYKEDIQVMVNQDANGNLKIVDSDPLLLDAMYSEGANTLMIGELAGELLKLVLPGRMFKPLRIRQTSSGLNIVIEAGRYEFADASYVWEDETPFDLSVVTASSGHKRPAIIGLDPVTNSIVTVSGDEVGIPMPDYTLTDYNRELVSPNPGKMWLGGFMRRNGVSTFQTEFDIIDLRAFIGVGGGLNGGQTFMPIELDFELTIPENRQVPVHRLYVVEGGSLYVHGALDITGV